MDAEVPQAAALKAAAPATLNCRAVTAEARAFVDNVTARITSDELRQGTRKNARVSTAAAFSKAIEGFLGDLMLAAGRERGGDWIKQSRKAEHFTEAPVSYKNFRALLAGLVRAGWVEIKGPVPTRVIPALFGRKPKYTNWAVSRFRATPALIDLAAQHGITEPSRHFAYVPLAPLMLRARSNRWDSDGNKVPGKPIDWREKLSPDLVAKGVELERGIQAVNDYLETVEIEGAAHGGYKRIFHNGDDKGFAWDQGGRLYSGYQIMPEEERLCIRMNGEAVCEIDVSASNLTIFLGLHGVQIDLGRDPYGIGDFPREVIKTWFTVTWGKSKLCDEWPKNKQKELGEYSPVLIAEAALKAYPALDALGNDDVRDAWAYLMYLESSAMLNATKLLMRDDIPSLSVHDALLVPVSAQRPAEFAIKAAYYGHCKAQPILKTRIAQPTEGQ